MSLLICILITFVVVILVLHLIDMLPIDVRAKQIVRSPSFESRRLLNGVVGRLRSPPPPL